MVLFRDTGFFLHVDPASYQPKRAPHEECVPFLFAMPRPSWANPDSCEFQAQAALVCSTLGPTEVTERSAAGWQAGC